MGRGKSEATKKRMLEDDLEKVKFMLFSDQEDKEFRDFSGKIEQDIKDASKNQSNEHNDKFSQEDIIKAILQKKDTMVVLPTGGGKSYCFQGPSFCFLGITLVITPLVALIQDQVKNFNDKYKKLYDRYEKGDEAIVGSKYYHGELYRAIYPGMNGLSIHEMFDEIAETQTEDTGKRVQYKLLYVSPERLANPKFVRELKKREEKGEIQIDFVVVDEAHCMSQWGFDFRESYLMVGKFMDQLKKRPIIAAFSATVTQQDRKQISSLLKFSKDAKHFLCYEKRSNLKLHTICCEDGKKKDDAQTVKAKQKENESKDTKSKKTKLKQQNKRMYELVKILKRNKGKLCVIYCTTISSVENLYTAFTDGKLKNYNFLPAKYHGQMSKSQKRKNLSRFLYQETVMVKEKEKNKLKKKPPTNIMIATKAFGMGIDCDNIEVVIHFDVPKSLEDYYQEIGRAGRGEAISANCYLLFNEVNIKKEIIRMISDTASEDFHKRVIASNFSEDMRKTVRFYMYYRMARMWDYCQKSSSNILQVEKVKDGQEYILNYFAEGDIGKSAKELLETFSAYIKENIWKKNKQDEDKYTTKSKKIEELFSFDEKFYESINSTKQEELIKELTKIVGQVNELHINNTKLANQLRWHGAKYHITNQEGNIEKNTIEIEEWKRNEENISKARNSLMRTDINEDTAFIRMRVPGTKLEDYVVPKWKKYDSENDSVKAIFIVNQFSNKVERILKKYGNNWVDISKDDKLSNLNNKDVNGLFPKEYFQDWYAMKEPFVQIKGKRERTVSFMLSVDLEEGKTLDDYKLNYFDLCVADAIYSIEVNGNKNIYIKTIWDVLSGYTKNSFTRVYQADKNQDEKKDKKKDETGIKYKIENSINKMRRIYISIEDGACEEQISNEVFLPIIENEKRGYTYQKIPPLYRYAEALNGEIIKVPVSLMNVTNIIKDEKKKGKEKKPEAEIQPAENTAKTYTTKAEIQPAENTAKTYTKSIENTVLLHYLLHRLAISRGRGRGNLVQFETIYKMVEPHMHSRKKKNMKIFKGKVLDILRFYKRIDYVSFGGYIKKFHYKFERGSDKIEYEGLALFKFTEEFVMDIEWTEDGVTVYDYQLSEKTKEVIRKNADSYNEYDGIIFYRNGKVNKFLRKRMDNQLDEHFDPTWIEEYRTMNKERIINLFKNK